MTDTVLTFNHARDKFTHLENLIQQLDDGDLDVAITLIGALLDRRSPASGDGSVGLVVPVSPRPVRPSRERDD